VANAEDAKFAALLKEEQVAKIPCVMVVGPVMEFEVDQEPHGGKVQVPVELALMDGNGIIPGHFNAIFEEWRFFPRMPRRNSIKS
jgi:hypothetical protein